MAIVNNAEWFITSDVAHEAAYRFDLPGPSQRRWKLSYLPEYWSLTKEQAVSGLVLAEMIILDTDFATAGLDLELAEIMAAELGLTLTSVMMLLAARAPTDSLSVALGAAADQDGAR
ncbi:hypothetical protein [Nocardia sp. NPDC058666]|uniref:hypothetical protein n=1 Tax=Nocardia sp. NPDC058666 TaxID=3346587 RepID=UPI0036494D70